jgi:hypothetical protein
MPFTTSVVIQAYLIPIVLVLVGMGWQFMPTPKRYPWLIAIICYSLAIILFADAVVYFRYSWIGVGISTILGFILFCIVSVVYVLNTAGTTKPIKAINVNPDSEIPATIGGIQYILAKINEINLKTAIELTTAITPEISESIENDFKEHFGVHGFNAKRQKETINHYLNRAKEKARDIPVVQKALQGDPDAIVKAYKEFGDLMDANCVGLKQSLSQNETYQNLQTLLLVKKLDVRLPLFSKKEVFLGNVERVNSLSYGLASVVRVREIVRKYKQMPTDMKMSLESIESRIRLAITATLDTLTVNWSGKKYHRLFYFIALLTAMAAGIHYRQWILVIIILLILVVFFVRIISKSRKMLKELLGTEV